MWTHMQTINCSLCGNEMKVGYCVDNENGYAVTENHPVYRIDLIKKDLAKEYFEGFRGSNGIVFHESRTICVECLKKFLYGNIIKENEELKKKNEEFEKRIKFYIANS